MENNESDPEKTVINEESEVKRQFVSSTREHPSSSTTAETPITVNAVRHDEPKPVKIKRTQNTKNNEPSCSTSHSNPLVLNNNIEENVTIPIRASRIHSTHNSKQTVYKANLKEFNFKKLDELISAGQKHTQHVLLCELLKRKTCKLFFLILVKFQKGQDIVSNVQFNSYLHPILDEHLVPSTWRMIKEKLDSQIEYFARRDWRIVRIEKFDFVICTYDVVGRPQIHSCQVCDKIFTRRYNLIRHQTDVHSLTNEHEDNETNSAYTTSIVYF
jgi:hypothetical protein